jgi:hypothetical protein
MAVLFQTSSDGILVKARCKENMTNQPFFQDKCTVLTAPFAQGLGSGTGS